MYSVLWQTGGREGGRDVSGEGGEGEARTMMVVVDIFSRHTVSLAY